MIIKTFKASIFVAALLTALPTMADEALVVTDAEGNETVFVLADKPLVSFSQEAIIVVAGEKRVEYPLSDYRKFSIAGVASSIGSEQLAASPTFRFDGGIVAEGLVPGTQVMVYNINGMMAGSGTADADGRASVSINGSGTFVVKAGNKSFKFIKK